MGNRWNQAGGMMNSPRWRSVSVGWSLKRGKRKTLKGRRKAGLG